MFSPNSSHPPQSKQSKRILQPDSQSSTFSSTGTFRPSSTARPPLPLSSIIIFNMERFGLFENPWDFFSPDKETYPALHRFVLRLASGVALADFGTDLKGRFPGGRAGRWRVDWQAKEVDWRRVLVIEEAWLRSSSRGRTPERTRR